VQREVDDVGAFTRQAFEISFRCIPAQKDRVGLWQIAGDGFNFGLTVRERNKLILFRAADRPNNWITAVCSLCPCRHADIGHFC
jgi:hypothetical protein